MKQARGTPAGVQEWVRAAGSDPTPSVGGARGEQRGIRALPEHPLAPGGLLPPPGPGLPDTQTHTQQHPSPPPVLPSTTAKMLLLLLGIIVLHVTVLVLLFVSTIVSVSTSFPLAPGAAGGAPWHGDTGGVIFICGLFSSLAFSRKPLLAFTVGGWSIWLQKRFPPWCCRV